MQPLTQTFLAYVFFGSQVVLAAPLLAHSSPDLALVETVGDCGPGLVVRGEPGDGVQISANSEFVVSEAAPRLRRDCVVKLEIEVPAGWRAHLLEPRLTLERTFLGQGRGNVSLHLLTDQGEAAEQFVLLEPAAVDGSFEIAFPTPREMLSSCGTNLRLSLAVDVTTRWVNDGNSAAPLAGVATLLWKSAEFAPITFTRCLPVAVP